MRLMFTTLLAVILSAAFPTTLAAETDQDHSHNVLPHTSTSESTPKLTWTQFKQIYHKQYASLAEEHYRSHVFARALRRMQKHNKKQNRSYDMHHNSFLDIDTSEFQEVYTRTYKSDPHSWNVSQELIRGNGEKWRGRGRSGKKMPEKDRYNHSITLGGLASENTTLDKQVDTMSRGRLLIGDADEIVNIDWSISSGKVRFQGTCGACYAFTAVETFAARYSRSFGFYLPLSIQQVVDCADNGLTFGCRGGYLQGSYTYLQTHGVVLQSKYPYTYENSSTSGKCQQQGGPFKLSSFSPIPEGDCKALISQLHSGPISVGIAGYGLQYYGSGVFDECSYNLDHAVMVVGYRSGLGWRIKNSWGREWGEDGYGWIAQGNTCGICNMAFSIKV